MLICSPRRGAGSAQRDTGDRGAKRRRDLARELDKRERKLQNELTQAQSALRKSGEREALREQGEVRSTQRCTISRPKRATRPKNVQPNSSRHKKGRKRRSRIWNGEARTWKTQIEDEAQLHWELDRAEDSELDDVTAGHYGIVTGERKGSAPSRKRKPLTITTPNGSRIFVGRTPIENAELTFRVARPNDLWFHVQKQPGAHVILQRDDAQEPPEADVLLAASFAAYHSKGRNSPKVTVDYTQRKHVRKRPAAAPGLVFYTHPLGVRRTGGAAGEAGKRDSQAAQFRLP